MLYYLTQFVVGVAQLVERLTVAQNVAGSSPVSHPIFETAEPQKLAKLLRFFFVFPAAEQFGGKEVFQGKRGSEGCQNPVRPCGLCLEHGYRRAAQERPGGGKPGEAHGLVAAEMHFQTGEGGILDRDGRRRAAEDDISVQFLGRDRRFILGKPERDGTAVDLGDHVVAPVFTERKEVGSAAAVQDVVAGTARDDIAAGTAGNAVVAIVAEQHVAAVGAPQDIVAGTAADRHAREGGTAVASAGHVDHVIARAGADLPDQAEAGARAEFGVDVVHEEGIAVCRVGEVQDIGIRSRAGERVADAVLARDPDGLPPSGHCRP